MRLIILICFLLVIFSADAQRFATASGNWTDAIWATTFNGTPGSAATPTSTDDVFTNGFSVTVNSDVSCRNLNVRRDVSNSLIIEEFSFATIDVFGYLSGANSTTPTPGTQPVTSADALTMGEFETIRLNGSGEKVRAWGYVCPLGNVIFNAGIGNTATITQGFRIANNASLTISTGITSIPSNSNARQLRGCSTCSLEIASGAELNTLSAINGGGTTSSDEPTTLFGSVSINGTLTTTNYVNSTNFSMGSSGVLQTSFNGATQTEGWWYQANGPTGGTVNAGSTTRFNASANQNLYARTYGNLILDASGTKTLTGSGTLDLLSNLTINSASVTFNSNASTAISLTGNVTNAGTWAPTDLVTFNGTGAQSIGGTSTISFNGGLEINKTSGILTLNRAVNISNGLTISQGTLNLGSQTATLNSGNIDNDGTFTVGSSTFIVNGSTSITGTSSVSFNNLQVGASGTLSATGTLNIAGNLSNAGSFNVNGVNFNGSAAQNVTGSYNLSSITVSNSVGVTNNGNISLTGALDLGGSGVFDADGSGAGVLTLISTSLTTGGRIATLTTPSNFSGNITLQRFVDGPDDWRYLSVPFTSANVGQWQATFPVTGNFSNASPNGVNGVVCSTCPSIYSWNAATQQYVAVGSGAATGSTSLSHLTGYSAYTYLTGNFTLSITGTPVKSGVNIPLSSGYNLIPNPYPSPIDWDNVTTTGTTNTVYMTTAQGSFATYLKGSGTCTGCNFNSGWRGELAIGQSFWIESSGATSISLTESAKTTGATFVREEEAKDLFRITLQSQGMNDDLVIHFDPQATLGTEIDLDARKRSNDYHINLSSYNTLPAEDYAINSVPLTTCESGSIKLKMSGITDGEHVLSFTELDKMTLGYTLTLVDNFMNVERIISNDEIYSFATSADPASKVDGRFELRFKSPTIETVASSSLQLAAECGSNLINVELDNSQIGIAYQLFYNSTEVSSKVIGNGGTIVTTILASSLPSGLSQLNLSANSLDGCQTMTFENIITYEKVSAPTVLSVVDDQVCYSENVTLMAAGSPETVEYKWYESGVATEPIASTVTGTWVIEGLEESKDFYVSTVNKFGCESLVRTKVSAVVTHVDVPQITIEGTTLISSSSVGNQWFKDGDIIPGASEPSYLVSETGNYSVQVSIEGCSASSQDVVMSITGLEDRANGVKLYPNPTKDWVIIELSEAVIAGLKSVSLKDMRGVSLLTQGKESVNGNSIAINLADSPKGIYLLDVKTQRGILVYRIVKD